ncbi:MAG TPA: Si-specific NAD(P)(+) transhydrogenase [Pirellulaceae bacterium]|nr:Si-specific NAD(P)(+) transhydrogenase [Pirellulaceae bacterium]
MAKNQYDVVVIGTGPGGEGAAMQAVKHGLKVAVVERFAKIGGGCTHWGTIPSKALRFAIFQMLEINSSRVFREAGISADVSFPDLRKTAESVIRQQEDMRRGFYERNNVPIYSGHARFVDPHTLEVGEAKGAQERVTADNLVIAVGSRPYRPPDIDFSHPRIFDSDTILNLGFTPWSITVYGAGVVGCEYASMFRNLGCKLNLVNTRAQLLEFLDDEICDALSYHLREKGALIRHGEQYEKIEGTDDGVILSLKSNKQLKTDILLWANGRTGNTDNLGLETIGIQPDSRGQLKVDDRYATSVPHIYAVGDVIGYPSLASAAYVQGRAAALHIAGDDCARLLANDIPTGIYTSPEISSVGKTERELTAAGVPYEVGHAQFKSLARAQITGQTVGMLKILFHRESRAVLGVHCFGANASEIIHIGQAILAQPPPNNTLMYFINTTFNYPTMAEAYRVAALNGYNRLF